MRKQPITIGTCEVRVCNICGSVPLPSSEWCRGCWALYKAESRDAKRRGVPFAKGFAARTRAALGLDPHVSVSAVMIAGLKASGEQQTA